MHKLISAALLFIFSQGLLAASGQDRPKFAIVVYAPCGGLQTGAKCEPFEEVVNDIKGMLQKKIAKRAHLADWQSDVAEINVDSEPGVAKLLRDTSDKNQNKDSGDTEHSAPPVNRLILLTHPVVKSKAGKKLRATAYEFEAKNDGGNEGRTSFDINGNSFPPDGQKFSFDIDINLAPEPGQDQQTVSLAELDKDLDIWHASYPKFFGTKLVALNCIINLSPDTNGVGRKIGNLAAQSWGKTQTFNAVAASEGLSGYHFLVDQSGTSSLDGDCLVPPAALETDTYELSIEFSVNATSTAGDDQINLGIIYGISKLGKSADEQEIVVPISDNNVSRTTISVRTSEIKKIVCHFARNWPVQTGASPDAVTFEACQENEAEIASNGPPS